MLLLSPTPPQIPPPALPLLLQADEFKPYNIVNGGRPGTAIDSNGIGGCTNGKEAWGCGNNANDAKKWSLHEVVPTNEPGTPPWPNNGGIPTSAQYESLAHLSLGHWDERNRDHRDDLRWMKRGIVSSTLHQLCLVRDRRKLNEVCESEYFFFPFFFFSII